MNSQHLQTFIWLRWRLLVHQFQRAGVTNAVFLGILSILLFLGVTFFTIIAFLGGLWFVTSMPAGNVPGIVMLVWDGMVICFLFTWGTALLAELQRSEALSLEKFLHLPVSLGGVFVLNYLSSLASFTVAALLPIMVGFSLGVCFSIGPAMLVVLPLLAAFLLMVTGISYQFQGWLATIMVNKRRRRTIIMVASLVFVLLCQLPNLANFMWLRPDQGAHNGPGKDREQQFFHEVQQAARIANLVLPPGWLPLGALAAAEGNVLPALLGTIGMTLIGSASLWRAYRTTLRLYTGQFSQRSRIEGNAPTPARPPMALDSAAISKKPAAGNLLEKRLPWVSEQATVIALAGLRSLLRAPESKMLLITPIIMVTIFGIMLFRGNVNLPEFARPFLGYGVITMSLFTVLGFVSNQFGFDRGGFRIFVLSPAPRRDILLGKNLAIMPLAVVLSILPLLVLQFMVPMPVEYFLAVPAQFLSMFLLMCMLANWLSILAPTPLPTGTSKRVQINTIPMLLQFLCLLLFPVVLAPAFVPLGLEFWLHKDWGNGVYLASTSIVCLAVVSLYLVMLIWQGKLLQAFEQKILQIVTTKAE